MQSRSSKYFIFFQISMSAQAFTIATTMPPVMTLKDLITVPAIQDFMGKEKTAVKVELL